MPPTTRRTLLAGLGAAALTGCSTRHTTPPADTVAATVTPSPTPLPPVTVNTATGPVLVPGAPMRVVALDTAEFDSALTLGITPVGAALAPWTPGSPTTGPPPGSAGSRGSATSATRTSRRSAPSGRTSSSPTRPATAPGTTSSARSPPRC